MLDINLTHEQQQKAVEQIQELMAQGIGSEAIKLWQKHYVKFIKKMGKEDSESK